MLTKKRILIMWIPLAVMWFAMGIEQPAITSIIARLPDVKVNLAAFGVAFAFVLILESPIIQLLTAGTALSTNIQNYKQLVTFTLYTSLVITIIHIIITVTPIFTLFLIHVMKVPVEIAEPARRSLLFMIPCSISVAFRRLWQGVLIRYGHTAVVAVSMFVRIITAALTLVFGLLFTNISGAALGGLTLTVGVFFAAVASYIAVRPVVKHEIPINTDASEPKLEFLKFYFPLALASFIILAARPIMTSGIALAPQPLESLAVWPVMQGFLFLFTSIGMSYQEIVVSLLKGKHEFRQLRKFSYSLSAGLSVIFLLCAILPISSLWFSGVAGLSNELLAYTVVPMFILALVPGLLSLVSWYRGVLVVRKQTAILSKGVVINLIFLTVPLFSGTLFLPVSGTVIAASSLALALTAEVLYLRRKITFS